jgi:hypothetical protein
MASSDSYRDMLGRVGTAHGRIVNALGRVRTAQANHKCAWASQNSARLSQRCARARRDRLEQVVASDALLPQVRCGLR